MNETTTPQDPDQVELRVFDRRVTVLLPPQKDPARRALLHRAWSRCLVDPAVGESPSAEAARPLDPAPPVLCDLRHLGSSSADAALSDATVEARLADRVTTLVTTRTMHSVLGEHLLLHSAGLSAPDGRVLALCAPPGTGKTTATRVIGRRFGYVTDETVCVEPTTGRVLPYPKPLQIIDPSVDSRKVAVGPDELGLLEPEDLSALRLGPVIVLDRSPDAAEPSITPMPLAEALPRIVAQTSSLHLLERPLQTLCTLMDRSGGPWLLHYAESSTLPDLLEAWLAGEETTSPGPERWEPAIASVTSADAPADRAAPERPGTVQRAAVQDAITMPGGIGVLRGGSFLLLQGIGATLWELLGTPLTVPELTEALVAEHGPAEEAEAATSELVEELLGHGVLQRSAEPATVVTAASR